ncbi:MAG: hypothetical protein ABI397_00495 [Candidatus Saccharimonas sp.]
MRQRIIKTIQSSVLLLVSLVTAVMVVSPQALAAGDTTANVIKVTPVRSDITVNPGESQTVKVIVTNLTTGTVNITATENDFIAGDESGTPSLILDAGKYAPTHSLKRFMVPIENMSIEAGKSVTADVVINVPKTAQAGGYFGAVRFQPTTPDTGGQVNLAPSVASLILLTVPGDAVEKLNLTEFKVQQNNKAGTYFQTPKDLNVTFRFENKGNLQESPFGKITLKKGNTVVSDHDFNDGTPKDVILPDSARRWTIPLENVDNFGHYTVSGTISYGKDNQTIEVSQSFWVIPMSYIVGAIIGLIVLIGLIVGGWMFLRNYKRRIVRDQNRGRLND